MLASLLWIDQQKHEQCGNETQPAMHNATHVGVLFPGVLGFEEATTCATLFTKIEQAFLNKEVVSCTTNLFGLLCHC